MELTKNQKIAVQKALKWYYLDSYNKNYFILCGLAGTGKSTVVKYIIEALALPPHYKVLFATPTGKAALRLRMNGLDANTIHKTFYNVYKSSTTGMVRFSKKKRLESNIKLIIIDEFSMINDAMIGDILSFRVPTIFLGDNHQLPPVFGKNSLISNEKNINVLLTEIMRQSDESGILDLAQYAIDNKPIPLGSYKKSNVLRYKDIIDEIHTYDVVLCWKNSTRIELNTMIRERLGYNDSIYPKQGEKVLTLRNNYEHIIESNDLEILIINGMISIMDLDAIEEKDFLICNFTPDFIYHGSNDTGFEEIKCYKNYFQYYNNSFTFLPTFKKKWQMINENGEKTQIEEQNDFIHMDFGYALTFFKAQGSEWDNVLILDEFQGSEDKYFKMIYTAITRARKKVDIVII